MQTNKPAVNNAAKGLRWYGLHFYPGVAEYQEPGKDAYRVYLNEDTLRKMDESFQGCPVYVHHVDEVPAGVDEAKKEADGWVLKSFFNTDDGKHWVEFITCTERAERAIKNGWQLSNCYIPKTFEQGGLCNGVSYQKEITAGDYEHLAIVPNPRYEESVILSPEDFKKYNAEKKIELAKVVNEKKGISIMGLSFFKRTKVENGFDLDMSVLLPKSQKEISLGKLVNDADEYEVKRNDMMASPEHHVEYGGAKMKLKDFMEAHKKLEDAYNELKGQGQAMNDDPVPPSSSPDASGGGHTLSGAGIASVSKAFGNEESELSEEEKKKKAEEMKKNEDCEAEKKKNAAKEKAERLKNAPFKAEETPVRVELSSDKLARGRQRYGSGN